ncbi:hypothetical protein [Emticicia sp. C21]|uniref:hypothetical protein n=1 Tax=Emticicia sp. C21 TaxID=2302915 RepID=UPI000E355A40|nr:hypothetical protein [Emticicia sp. C21]RFS14634.1 hypothetical protein D0T08_20600 [Emticicia sp. C21]
MDIKSYNQVVSECIKVPSTKMGPKKVTNMGGTFLNDSSDGFKISATKKGLKKVTNIVGTFLTDNSIGFRISAAKRTWKRLPIWGEPF